MLIPVILSGGAGTRLWPVSREAHPKPFMRLADGQSLLQKTFIRSLSLATAGHVLTVTNRDHYFKSKDEYEAVVGSTASISPLFLLEPSGRNTAPAIALAAMKVAESFGPDAILLVMAADHLIENAPAFEQAVDRASILAQRGSLVTFGIVPSEPETGYGYIECGAPCNEGGGFEVACFIEKPIYERAAEYVSSGRHLWNSGMFCFSARTILEQLEKHAPAVYQGAIECWSATKNKNAARQTMMEIDQDTFSRLPDISIDYAVMEKAQNVMVVPGDFGWSDIGSWSAVSALAEADGAGNRVVGNAVLVDAEDCYVQSDARLIAAVGVENLIIVDTSDALLVTDRRRTQDVKKVVQQLKAMGHDSHKLHRTVVRPWGTYTVLEEGEGFKIKRIVVKPGASLSLQMHKHRSEHWVVVSGTARVVNGETTVEVTTNQSTYIPAGHKHRLENAEQNELILIEVQSGSYLGEDDIVRLDDRYGRN